MAIEFKLYFAGVSTKKKTANKIPTKDRTDKSPNFEKIYEILVVAKLQIKTGKWKIMTEMTFFAKSLTKEAKTNYSGKSPLSIKMPQNLYILLQNTLFRIATIKIS